MGFNTAPPAAPPAAAPSLTSVRTTAPTETLQAAPGQGHIGLTLEEGKNYARLASAALINSTIRDTERHYEFELTNIRQQLMTTGIVHTDAEAPLPPAINVPIHPETPSIGDAGTVPGSMFVQSENATLGDLAYIAAAIDPELGAAFEAAGVEEEMVPRPMVGIG